MRRIRTKAKTNRLAIAASAFLLFCVSNLKAGGFNLDSLGSRDLGASAEAGPVNPEKQSYPEKEWTVMVFMNAKNDLGQSHYLGLSESWAEKDLAEMKRVGTTDKVNIVVEYGVSGKGSRRILIGKSGRAGRDETVYGRDPDADMGDYRHVIEFAKWARTAFPARKYMFILWNHGRGWTDPDRNEPGGRLSKGILFDDETKNYVRTSQLGDILKQTGYVDVLAMNACWMQMAEVAYEIKDNAGLIVASEERLLKYGFDYAKLLSFINDNTGADNGQLSDFFIGWYKELYAGGAPFLGGINTPLDAVTGTLSTVRPRALDRLPGRLDAFAGAAMKYNETEAVKAAVANVIRFDSLDQKNDVKKMKSAYVDLYDFARIVGANARNRETRLAADDLMSFIKSELVMRSVGINYDAENGYDYSTVGGIAINMTIKSKAPRLQSASGSGTKYADLALSKASLWDEFINWTDAVWNGI